MTMSQEGACDISLSLELSIGRSRRSAKECSEPCFTCSLSDSFGASDAGLSVKKEIASHDIACEEVEVEGLSLFRSGTGSDEDDDVGVRKKLRLTKEQSALLENRFKEHSTINTRQKHALAQQLNLRPRQIEVWFQNRRARTKLKQMEVDCEFQKKRCQKLSDENRRLHKELQQIKTLLKAAPSHMSFPAAVNLTICPSCGRRGHSSAGNDQ
ncbi:homeobox-leucine zipper protein HAT22-like [Curcuma longa]|uniref:homeobox-leucine zipper protein HAT22-like n=1 Tax=Curcuma longa TaxID=136217 RepID=UPI003D9F0410